MRACVVKDYEVLVSDREVEARAQVIAEMVRDRDPSYPAWQDLPAHTQLDLMAVARRGMEEGGGQ